MKDFFQELFAYNQHCNSQFLEVFERNPATLSERAEKLMSHVLNAHHIWNHRILSKPSSFGVWEVHPVKNLRSLSELNQQMSLELLEQVDLNACIHYSNTHGKQFQNQVRDILFHLINHSNYHRGQIARELKQHGLEAPVSDFIIYQREKIENLD